jgi:chromosomal replication initiation ATPase DnaA
MTSSAPAKPFKDVHSKEFRLHLLETLAELNGDTFSADQGVAYHKEPPNKISLPEGMTPAQGSKALSDVAIALDQKEVFSRVFKYRPADGAYALVQVLSKFFGTTGRGVPIKTMFGTQPPKQIEVEIGLDETVQVPWGHIEFAPFEGTLMLGTSEDSEYGVLFELSVQCPKRFGASVAGFFKAIQHQLETESIYKGKSIRTSKSNDGVDEIRFISTSEDKTIVYNDEVMGALEHTVWGVIRNAELLKADGRKTNNRVLVHGPYGTGKSECGKITGNVANQNGWTFLKFESSKGSIDDLDRTLATARLYSPAVVMIEDIDTYAANPDANYQSRLSNMFDGLGSKGDQVMILMTSNRAAEFSKGMLRAGRIDRMIEIGALDRTATEDMIRRVIGENRLEDNVDFDRVWEHLEDFEPAFVRQTFDQAATAALIRTGKRDFKLGTEDFVNAANILRPQHDMHRDKSDKREGFSVEGWLRDQVVEALTRQIDTKVELSGDVDVSGEAVNEKREHARA